MIYVNHGGTTSTLVLVPNRSTSFSFPLCNGHISVSPLGVKRQGALLWLHFNTREPYYVYISTLQNRSLTMSTFQHPRALLCFHFNTPRSFPPCSRQGGPASPGRCVRALASKEGVHNRLSGPKTHFVHQNQACKIPAQLLEGQLASL